MVALLPDAVKIWSCASLELASAPPPRINLDEGRNALPFPSIWKAVAFDEVATTNEGYVVDVFDTESVPHGVLVPTPNFPF